MAFGDYEQQVIEAQRRRAVANQLAQQAAVNPVDYGARFVPERGSIAPIRGGEQLANLGQMLGSAWMAHRADKKAQAAEDTALKARDTSLASAVENYRNAVPDSQVGDAMGSTIVGNAMRTAANPPTNYVQPQAPQPQPPMGRTQATNNLLDTAMPREQIAQSMLQRILEPPKPMIVPENASVIDANNPGLGLVIRGTPKKHLANVTQTTGDKTRVGTLDTEEGTRTWEPWQNMGSKPVQGALAEDEAALAQALYTRGVPPPQGARGAAMKGTLRAMIDQHPDLNIDQLADAARAGKINFGASTTAAKAPIQASQAALANNEKMLAAAGGFSSTLDKNLTALEEAYAKLGDNSPVANKLSRYYAQNVSGDADTAVALKWLRDVEGEYAKLSSGSMGNAPASDQAQRSAHDVINKYMTQGGMKAVIAGMRQEKENRISSIQSESERLRNEIAQMGGTAPAAAAAPAASGPKVFATEDDALAAERAGKLAVGEKVVIGGQAGTWSDQ